MPPLPPPRCLVSPDTPRQVAARGVAVRVVFIEREHGPERLVCEAEVIFEAEAGPLAGMKLVGFSLWRSPEAEIYVTFPSRAFGAGNERRFFDYLRSVEGTSADSKRVKLWIMEQYRNRAEATAA